MLDHFAMTVSDVKRADAFYQAALKPLGIVQIMRLETAAGFGIDRPSFWITQGKIVQAAPPVHVCFPATTRALVDEFYQVALAAGGRDNGPPGLRPHYHANYYGAFVLDFDGYNVEAVCRTPV